MELSNYSFGDLNSQRIYGQALEGVSWWCSKRTCLCLSLIF